MELFIHKHIVQEGSKVSEGSSVVYSIYSIYTVILFIFALYKITDKFCWLVYLICCNLYVVFYINHRYMF